MTDLLSSVDSAYRDLQRNRRISAACFVLATAIQTQDNSWPLALSPAGQPGPSAGNNIAAGNESSPSDPGIASGNARPRAFNSA